jgi:hypothetical protein
MESGLREGVKMVLDRGALVTVDQFKHKVADKNLNNLTSMAKRRLRRRKWRLGNLRSKTRHISYNVNRL